MRGACDSLRVAVKGGDEMSRMTLKYRTVTGADPVVKLDGKIVKFRKNKFGNYSAEVEVNDGATLSAECYDTILSPLWLLWEMLYFVISVFGIFDPLRNTIKRAFTYEAVLHPSDNAQATLTVVRSGGEGSPAAELECNFDAEVVKNEYYGYGLIRKRRVIALIIKIAAWLALIATAIAVVANTMGR